MKKFAFRLEALLRVRKSRVKLLQKELGSAKEKWERLQEEGYSLSNEISNTENEIRKIRSKGDLLAEQNYEHFLLHLKERYMKLNSLLEKQQREFLLKQEQVSEAVQGRKMVENIKEKQYTHWQHQNEKVGDEEHACRRSYPE